MLLSPLTSQRSQAVALPTHTRPTPRILLESLPPNEGIYIPKFVSKPLKKGYGFKFGIFADIHGDEEAGILAANELIRWASEKP